jgi:hypothetical protein
MVTLSYWHPGRGRMGRKQDYSDRGDLRRHSWGTTAFLQFLQHKTSPKCVISKQERVWRLLPAFRGEMGHKLNWLIWDRTWIRPRPLPSKWFLTHYLSVIPLSDALYCRLLLFIISGVRLSPLGTAATSGLLYKPQMVDEGDCGATGRMKIGRGNRSTRRKPAPATLCPPQIPHDQTRARTRAAAVGSQRLTAWAMARPILPILKTLLNNSRKNIIGADIRFYRRLN